MSAQHTPGPWFVSKKNPLRVIESGPRALTLASAGTTGRGVTLDGAQCEAEANARLIAAAPELLAALQEMLAVYGNDGHFHPPAREAMRLASAAIAKATGSQQ
ncbi:hypothetical protein [uncultured Hydrogenophaga sp.]|uniref:hypothetical protein n=1 Tax=uncultured Hydrogenophaga sp. TaxID=199683 RepID=UPI002584FF88|nr:hypothetical protein [uncultured Hydrogenophaga sp.]